MRDVMTAPKEFWLGIVYLVFGGVGLWYAFDYPMGTPMRMGPGYMPAVISGLLVVFAVASFARAFRMQGEAIGRLAARPAAFVLAGVLAFAALAERAGLIIAIAALVLLAAAGSRDFRLQWMPLAGLAAFIALCALVFVRGLGVSIPLLGHWFGG